MSRLNRQARQMAKLVERNKRKTDTAALEAVKVKHAAEAAELRGLIEQFLRRAESSSASFGMMPVKAPVGPGDFVLVWRAAWPLFLHHDATEVYLLSDGRIMYRLQQRAYRPEKLERPADYTECVRQLLARTN